MHSGEEKTPPERGFREERLKGLEPSTFCITSASTLSPVVAIYLQNGVFASRFLVVTVRFGHDSPGLGN
jgi:hypothetical protein